MISYDTLIKEMEKHILLARSSKNNQELREHLSAIRALCDVGLVQSDVESINIQRPANIQEVTNLPSTSAKLEEEDANGTSIFDF